MISFFKNFIHRDCTKQIEHWKHASDVYFNAQEAEKNKCESLKKFMQETNTAFRTDIDRLKGEIEELKKQIPIPEPIKQETTHSLGDKIKYFRTKIAEANKDKQNQGPKKKHKDEKNKRSH